MKTINQFTYLILLAITLSIFTTCKKEKAITQNPNNFGTLFGSGGNYVLKGVLKSADNNYILYGYTNQTTNGNYDGFVLKVDDKFNTLWYKTLGGKYDDFINSAVLDDEGNIMTVGTSYSYGVAVDSMYKNSNSLFYTVYLDNNGTIINEKTFQPNASNQINRGNEANKVLFLPNKTFAIVGTTSNYLTLIDGKNWYTPDALIFGINKKMDKLWQGRYFASPPLSNDYYEAEEYCYDACLTEDGNIMMHVVTLANTPFINTIKIPFTGPTSANNDFLQKSIPFINIVSSLNGYGTIIEGARNNSVALYDITRGGIVITNDDGSNYKIIKLGIPMGINSITKHDNKLYISGRHLEYGKTTSYPRWAITDLEGKIIEEHFLNLPDAISTLISLKKIMVNENSEVLAFGIYKNVTGNNIIMLRLDKEGNLIK